MSQPWLWSALPVVVVIAGAVRLVARRPFVVRRAAPVPAPALVIAVLSALALVFHCAAMFFGPWVALIPGTAEPAGAVNAMGTASQCAYWVPAALLLASLWRVWWPALLVLGVCLLGVGLTMYLPFTLDTHLMWLTAVILVGAAVFTGFVGQSLPSRGAVRTEQPAHT